jgi:hypothetical protein
MIYGNGNSSMKKMEKNEDSDQQDYVEDDNDTIQIHMAMREARRHLIANSKNYNATVVHLKATLRWRKVGSLTVSNDVVS